MKNETRERNREIYEMYVQGFTGGKQYSMSEIAEIYGLTKQRISAIIIAEKKKSDCSSKCSKRKLETVADVVYPAIKEWIIEHNLSLNQFVRKMGFTRYAKAYRFLRGDDLGNIKIIKAVLGTTGLTFEEAFKEENEDGEDCANERWQAESEEGAD